MGHYLPRGYSVLPEVRIKKTVAEGEEWQIYLTNTDIYVLAVSPSLYTSWIKDYSLPNGLFTEDVAHNCRVFVSSGDYLVSSLELGPFPENNNQIEAFSVAFKTTTDMFPTADLHDAIYLEKYSLLLPVSYNKGSTDNAVVYGKWLTGGIGISIEAFPRVCKIMSWLPKEALSKSVKMAGFEITESEKTAEDNEIEDQKKCASEESVRIAEPEVEKPGRFTLVGRPELEQFFNDNIIDIVLHQEQYKRMGIPFPGATILYGPPGCGKTFAVEKLSEYLGWKRFDIDSSSIGSSYIHETSKKISEVFNSAIKAAPSILVIDEMEAFLADRGAAGPSGLHHVEEVAEFLRRIPEAISKGVLVFAMTNRIESIDPAILRRGRFDHKIEVKMASAEEIEQLLAYKLRELPTEEGIDIGLVANKLAGHPMSDVAFVLREAGRFAVKRHLEFISNDCLLAAVDLLPKEKEKPRIGF